MARTIYTFDLAGMQALARDHQRLRGQFENLVKLLGVTHGVGIGQLIVIGKAGSSIAARSGSTFGSGDVTIWKYTRAGVASATTRVVKGYNISGGTVASGKFLVMLRDRMTGRHLILFEDCL